MKLNISDWQRTGYNINFSSGVNVSREWRLGSSSGEEYHISEVSVTTGMTAHITRDPISRLQVHTHTQV